MQDPKSLQLLAGLVEAAMKSPLRGENFYMVVIIVMMVMMTMMGILHDDDNVGNLGEAPYII